MTGWAGFWRRQAIPALLLASGSGVNSWLRRFRALEASPPAVVQEHQRRQLLALLRHCRTHVPWYRLQIARCDIDLSEHDFSLDDLGRLPILTKDTIRREGEALYSDDRAQRGVFRNTSGGSTGEPVVFLQDRAYNAQNVVAAKIIYNELLGKRAGELEFNLWGSEGDIARGDLGAKQKLVNYLYSRRFQNFFLVATTGDWRNTATRSIATNPSRSGPM